LSVGKTILFLFASSRPTAFSTAGGATQNACVYFSSRSTASMMFPRIDAGPWPRPRPIVGKITVRNGPIAQLNSAKQRKTGPDQFRPAGMP